MLVKTPAIKLGVEIREARVEDNHVVLAGVANAMPCAVVIGGPEMVRLFTRMLRPAIIGLFLRSVLGLGRPKEKTE